MFGLLRVRRAFASITLVIGVVLPGAVHAENWRMASIYPESNFHTKNINAFIKNVKEATGGTLNIRLSSGSSLYKAPDILDAVETGQIQIAEITFAAHSNESPLYAMDAIPYIISGYDQAFALYQATKPLLDAEFEKRGLTLLYAVAWPGTGIYSAKPLDKIKDLTSIRMRSPAPIVAEWTKKMNISNVVIQTPELAQAFSSGMIDAMFTSSPVGISIQAWEFTKYFYDLGALQAKNGVVVRTDKLNSLSAHDRQAVLDQAAIAESKGWALSKEADQGYKNMLAAGGMTIGPINPEVEAYLRANAAEVIAEWMASAPINLRKAVESVRNDQSL